MSAARWPRRKRNRRNPLLPNILRSKPALVASALLLLQAGMLFSSIRPEAVPASEPLSGVPTESGGWSMIREIPVEAEVMEVLKADDTVNRIYAKGDVQASLFVAGFRSQRNGKAPHSPKNCLPGAGWVPLESSESIVETDSGPVNVNRYVIAFGNSRSLVMYWYQSRDRTVASEYEAKFWVMMDAMRYNRTDTALVRVIVPVPEQATTDSAAKIAGDFIRSFYGPVRQHLPS